MVGRRGHGFTGHGEEFGMGFSVTYVSGELVGMGFFFFSFFFLFFFFSRFKYFQVDSVTLLKFGLYSSINTLPSLV